MSRTKEDYLNYWYYPGTNYSTWLKQDESMIKEIKDGKKYHLFNGNGYYKSSSFKEKELVNKAKNDLTQGDTFYIFELTKSIQPKPIEHTVTEY